MADKANDRANKSLADPLEECVEAFETVWRQVKVPAIEDHLSRCRARDDADLRRCLQELVLVDLEYRWRTDHFDAASADALGPRPTLRQYVQRFPQIGDVRSCDAAFLAEEYRVRRLWGDAPTRDRFLADYPEQLADLIVELQRVDEQLRADGVMRRPTTIEALSPDPRAPLPWQDYILQRHVGTGGMGRVYVAWQKSLNRRVAVKALLKARQTDLDAVEAFLREATIVGRLRHPNIVGVHGLGRFPGGGYFLVMDYIRGENLETWLRHELSTSIEAMRILREIAGAIVYAHEQGVVHCDLKPRNILIDEQRHVYVVDFGLARLAGTAAHADARVLGGTWSHMAPEQLECPARPVDPRIDVFGLGGILYTLLTAKPPRQGQAPVQPFDAWPAIQPPNMLRPDVPDGLATVCMKCLSEQPADRFPNAAAVVSALDRWAAAQP